MSDDNGVRSASRQVRTRRNVGVLESRRREAAMALEKRIDEAGRYLVSIGEHPTWSWSDLTRADVVRFNEKRSAL
jgi:hypothetical protein